MVLVSKRHTSNKCVFLRMGSILAAYSLSLGEPDNLRMDRFVLSSDMSPNVRPMFVI
jgi:hypothetical protein